MPDAKRREQCKSSCQTSEHTPLLRSLCAIVKSEIQLFHRPGWTCTPATESLSHKPRLRGTAALQVKWRPSNLPTFHPPTLPFYGNRISCCSGFFCPT